MALLADLYKVLEFALLLGGFSLGLLLLLFQLSRLFGTFIWCQQIVVVKAAASCSSVSCTPPLPWPSPFPTVSVGRGVNPWPSLVPILWVLVAVIVNVLIACAVAVACARTCSVLVGWVHGSNSFTLVSSFYVFVHAKAIPIFSTGYAQVQMAYVIRMGY